MSKKEFIKGVDSEVRYLIQWLKETKIHARQENSDVRLRQLDNDVRGVFTSASRMEKLLIAHKNAD